MKLRKLSFALSVILAVLASILAVISEPDRFYWLLSWAAWSVMAFVEYMALKP